MKEKYHIIISILIFNLSIFAQGVGFPNEPNQAPIGGFWALAAGGAALAYKKFRDK